MWFVRLFSPYLYFTYAQIEYICKKNIFDLRDANIIKKWFSFHIIDDDCQMYHSNMSIIIIIINIDLMKITTTTEKSKQIYRTDSVKSILQKYSFHHHHYQKVFYSFSNVNTTNENKRKKLPQTNERPKNHQNQIKN